MQTRMGGGGGGHGLFRLVWLVGLFVRSSHLWWWEEIYGIIGGGTVSRTARTYFFSSRTVGVAAL